MYSVRELFSRVINPNNKKGIDIDAVINRLSESRTLRNYTLSDNYFLSLLSKISSIPEMDDESLTFATGKTVSLTPKRKEDAGTYGVIRRSADGKIIYKSITINVDDFDGDFDEYNILSSPPTTIKNAFMEYNIRKIFVEAFIQVVLASDPIVGKYVCSPTGLYRSKQTNSETSLTIYIVMEPIEYTFKQYLTTKRTISMSWFGPLLYELGLTLSTLRDRYGFAHRDLHAANIMITDTGHLKLIDFGFSCMTIKDKIYREITMDDTLVGCNPGYDLAIFFYFMYNRYLNLFDNDVTMFYKKYVVDNLSGKFNLLGYARDTERTHGKGCGHFSLYYYKIENGGALKRELSKIRILDPAFLMEQLAPAGVGAPMAPLTLPPPSNFRPPPAGVGAPIAPPPAQNISLQDWLQRRGAGSGVLPTLPVLPALSLPPSNFPPPPAGVGAPIAPPPAQNISLQDWLQRRGAGSGVLPTLPGLPALPLIPGHNPPTYTYGGRRKSRKSKRSGRKTRKMH